MKKFSLLIIGLIIVVVTYSCPGVAKSLTQNNDITVTYYTSGNTGGKGVFLYGNTYFVTTTKKNSENVEKGLCNIMGVSAKFDGNYDDFIAVQKKCRVAVISSENLNDAFIICGYSDKFGKGVIVNGKMVNVQIAIRSNTITVGTPLIMGSY